MLLKSKFIQILFLASFFLFFTNTASAHCDSMEGPVVEAAQNSLETGNINYTLIWVPIIDEEEIKKLFKKVLRVRKLDADAKDLTDMFFFETVVRLHRLSEGEPYTGIKPAGYHPSEGIEAADLAIERNSLDEVLPLLDKAQHPKVEHYFSDLQSKKNFDMNDVEAGREYVESYVHFIHYVEGLLTGETEHGMHK
jgi:hypothetical protein